MRGNLLMCALFFLCVGIYGQQHSSIKEYKKTFKTYPFSDPDPVPEIGKIYPYFRYDGYTDKPVNKEWKVVELENNFIKVMVLPEIGGKIWAAIEKSTGKSFIYYNSVVKFRDVAMRGPWTSGGLEPNYGIVGHTPNCATPVDYKLIKKDDGSVSCVVGVLELLTRSYWRIDINLQKDKAYFTTSSTWYNASPFEQPYYHWMNGALRAADDLEFIFPGTKYIGHAGEYADWPIDKQGRNLAYYKNNNFGSYKSYHVFGKYTDFWGGYYHNEDFGMARYSTYNDKAGKKIWIWGLSREGMIWEKLLTDTDGQYVEVQSGRLFNQPAEGSSLTPFKNRSFFPHITDVWTEYWFPVMKTKGFVTANNYGSLNLKRSDNKLVIYFSPVQPIDDEIKIVSGEKTLYAKKLNLKTLEVFADSAAISGQPDTDLKVMLGDKLMYTYSSESDDLSRPFETPTAFNWNSAQGLQIQGKELIRQRMYAQAEEKLNASLKSDPYYLPALADMSMLLFRQMKYDDALAAAKKGLSIDAYDPACNYYYGLINEQRGNLTDAKDGYSISAQAAEYRSASHTRLAGILFREKNYQLSALNAQRAIEANSAAFDAYQILAMIERKKGNTKKAASLLDTIAAIDPLNHFANFERYLLNETENNKTQFTSLIQNEMPEQTFLELAIWYDRAGEKETALQVLELSKSNAEIAYWKAHLSGEPIDTALLKPGLVFPFRHETAAVLEELIKKNDHWLLKYDLGLIKWNSNQLDAAKKLFDACGQQPSYAPFYAVRAKLYSDDSTRSVADLLKAHSLDKNEWRYGRALVNFYLLHDDHSKAIALASSEYKKHPSSYILGMLLAKAHISAKNYEAADRLLQNLYVLPNEGATGGRQLYRETKLMLALKHMKAGNCRKALQYLSQSKEWPERLGSGKPYDEDIDERLEDWMSYQCLATTDKKAAEEMLKKIVDYKTSGEAQLTPSLNNLITAWALKKSGKEQQAAQMLRDIAAKHPSNQIAQWTLSAYEGDATPVPAKLKSNENLVILQEMMSLNR